MKIHVLRSSISGRATRDIPLWRDIESVVLQRFMGKKPEHFPGTEVKLAYDDETVHVMFRVEDRFVRACAEKHQDRVCIDSCVEFFFTPGRDISRGYFNIEVNCGGTAKFCYQTARDENCVKLPITVIEEMHIAASLPRIVDPEIAKPTIWSVSYQIPLAVLGNYGPAVRPAPGVEWRGNFYKCADETSHPHWLTWAPVDLPKPDFHQPKYFGTIAFE